MNASEVTPQPSSLEGRLVSLERRVTTLRGGIEALAWASLAGPLGVLLLLVKRPGGLLMSQVFNLGHVLLSGVVAWAAFRISSQVFADRTLRFHLVTGMVAVGVLGGGLEVAQHYAPGEPSWWDMGIDLCGGLAATLALAAGRGGFSKPIRWALAGASLVVFVAAAASAVRDIARELERGVRFPTLATFAESERGAFLVNGGATLNLRDTPAGAREVLGQKAPLLSLPAQPLAGIQVIPPRGDWSGFSTLHLFAFSLAQKPVPMELRVHDRAHTGVYEDRFNQALVVNPGPNDIYLMTSDIERATNGRRLDLSEIDGIVFFVSTPSGPVDLFLGPWRLEAARERH